VIMTQTDSDCFCVLCGFSEKLFLTLTYFEYYFQVREPGISRERPLATNW